MNMMYLIKFSSQCLDYLELEVYYCQVVKRRRDQARSFSLKRKCQRRHIIKVNLSSATKKVVERRAKSVFEDVDAKKASKGKGRGSIKFNFWNFRIPIWLAHLQTMQHQQARVEKQEIHNK